MKNEAQVMEVMRSSLGMIIPVWYPPGLTDAQVRDNLLITLHDCEHYLRWGRVVLVVDGDARSQAVVRELQGACRQRHGQAFEAIYHPENRGKGFAVVRGIQWLLQERAIEYVTIRDADGDHAVNDLVNLMRLALELHAREGTNLLIIVGRRTHVHRALGWLRGEFETLLNRVLVDAMRFALAQHQQVLKTLYFASAEGYPDLHSGYKVYSRQVCELTAARAWEFPPWVGPEVYRYGVEAVPFVEGALSGAVVGEVTRLTRDPEFSGHSAFTRPEVNASVLLWAFLRLGITPPQAAALMDNHFPHLALWTETNGRAPLLALREYVLRRLQQSIGIESAHRQA
jgi:hypothetical protein